jgi:hypothetical protein
MMNGLNEDAFYYTTGIPCLEDCLLVIRGESLMVSLNAGHMAARTCAARRSSVEECGEGRARCRVTEEALGLMGYPISRHDQDEGPVVVLEEGGWDPSHSRWGALDAVPETCASKTARWLATRSGQGLY